MAITGGAGSSVTSGIYSSDPFSNAFTTPGQVITSAMPYIFVIAGLCLLFMLITGGITLMTAAGDQGKTKEGYGKVTAGLIGFLLIFVAYFVAQIIEVVLGVKFL